MYALIQNNEIVKVFSNPEGFILDGNQYSSQIFFLWSKEEKQEIGIYEIETDSSNFKDESYYINTNEIFAFSNGKAIRKWGTATPKQLEDVNATDENGEPVIQDATGSRTLTWNSAYEFTGDTAPTLTTTVSKADLFVFRYNGTVWYEMGRNLNLSIT